MTADPSASPPVDGTLLTVAPTGAEHDRAAVPAIASGPEELASTAAACQAAGAAMIHVHARDEQHAPSLDPGLLRACVAAIREASDLVVQLSTGGGVHDPFAARLAVLDTAPDSCSLTLGTLNFGDDVFHNPWGFIQDLFLLARERRVVPEFEVFDVGHLWTLRRLLDTHGLPFGEGVHVDLVLGVAGGLPGTPQALMAALAAFPPEVTTWSATGVGRSHLPVMATALAAGGHARVGIEDVTTFARGEKADNVRLVQRAAELATLLQRPAMTPDQARRLLGTR